MFAAAGVTAAATSDIWVPVLVSSAVGIAGSISAFFIGRSTQSTPNKTEEKLKKLRKEQVKRDIKTREDANGLASDTKKEVGKVIDQSKKQQAQLELNNKKLNTTINTADESNQKLNQVASSLQQTAISSQQNMTHTTQELQQLQEALAVVNERLRQTQEQLSSKEHDLTASITHLASMQQQLAQETQTSTQRIHELTEQLATVTNSANPSLMVKNAEIASLKSENARMASNIQALESVVERLSAALKSSKESNAGNLTEIRKLIEDNKRLHANINQLSKQLDGDAALDTKDHANHSRRGVRLFGT
jgi:chromosome segregation ATPase